MKKYTQTNYKKNNPINKRLKRDTIPLLILALVLFIGIFSVAILRNNTTSTHAQISETIIDIKVDEVALSVEEQLHTIALENDFDPQVLIALSMCESSHRPLVRGDNGHSRGLFQIHDYFHPEVSDEVAFNIRLSAEWTIWRIQTGHANEWACWNKI